MMIASTRVSTTISARTTQCSAASAFSAVDFFPRGGLRLPEPAFGGAIRVIENDSVSIALGYNHIFSPTVFNTLKLGYNVIKTNRKAPTETNYNKQIGVQGLPYDLPRVRAVQNLELPLARIGNRVADSYRLPGSPDKR